MLKGNPFPRLCIGTSLVSRKAYKFYREQTKGEKRENRLHTHGEVKKVVNALWKEVSNGLLDKDGGVQVDGMGYFGIYRSPTKKVYKYGFFASRKGKAQYNDHSEHYVYLPLFYSSTVRGTPFTFWRMDYAFNDAWKKELRKRLIRGKRYRNYCFYLRHLNRANKK